MDALASFEYDLPAASLPKHHEVVVELLSTRSRIAMPNFIQGSLYTLNREYVSDISGQELLKKINIPQIPL
jgi:hypothetical protein